MCLARLGLGWKGHKKIVPIYLALSNNFCLVMLFVRDFYPLILQQAKRGTPEEPNTYTSGAWISYSYKIDIVSNSILRGVIFISKHP